MKQYHVRIDVTAPAWHSCPTPLFYTVEAWDTEDAENRAFARASREYAIWRDWVKFSVTRQKVSA